MLSLSSNTSFIICKPFRELGNPLYNKICIAISNISSLVQPTFKAPWICDFNWGTAFPKVNNEDNETNSLNFISNSLWL